MGAQEEGRVTMDTFSQCQVPYDRKIKSDLKSHKVIEEIEHPVRWSFMKVLRENSNLKQFYPDVDPYAEAYRFRDNIYCIFSESLDGAGDPWSYLIKGPERCMLIDTGFGVGDLKALVRRLVGDKPLIVVNTHSHVDHALGDYQFDEVWCHVAEEHRLRQQLDPHSRDYLFDESGNPRWTVFDREDLIPYREFAVRTFEDGHVFDLGGGYEVEAVLLPGHTPGQCGFLDRWNMVLFTGDVTGIGHAEPGEPYAQNMTVRAMRDAYRHLQPRFDEITGVFPGHGALDQSSLTLRYQLEALEAIVENPNCYDIKKTFVGGRGISRVAYLRFIYQGTAIRYTMDSVG